MIWRVVTHEHTRGQSYAEICSDWTLNDLQAANVLLDTIDAATAAAMKRAEQQRTAAKGGY
jgi:hypothetical protein